MINNNLILASRIFIDPRDILSINVSKVGDVSAVSLWRDPGCWNYRKLRGGIKVGMLLREGIGIICMIGKKSLRDLRRVNRRLIGLCKVRANLRKNTVPCTSIRILSNFNPKPSFIA